MTIEEMIPEQGGHKRGIVGKGEGVRRGEV
jgi:hypothetical protein